PHLSRWQMHTLTMAGQDPLEGKSLELANRPNLIRPGVPAIVARGIKPLLLAVPVEMIACEEKAIAIKQGAVARAVARRWDHLKLGKSLNGAETREYPLRSRL